MQARILESQRFIFYFLSLFNRHLLRGGSRPMAGDSSMMPAFTFSRAFSSQRSSGSQISSWLRFLWMRLLSPGLLFLLFLEFGCGKKSPTAPELQNQPPVIKTYTPSTSQVQLVPGQSQKFEVEATDSDGDSLQYRWLLSGREVATTELPYNLNNNGRDYNLGTITTVDATDFKFDDITNLLRG
ncbi:MAG: hypothetical protein ACE5NG_05695, partial [bacterium]